MERHVGQHADGAGQHIERFDESFCSVLNIMAALRFLLRCQLRYVNIEAFRALHPKVDSNRRLVAK